MSQYTNEVDLVQKYCDEKIKNMDQTLQLSDASIRKEHNHSRYFAATSKNTVKLPPTFLYFKSLLTPTSWTANEKRHLVEVVAAQLQNSEAVNWEEVSNTLKYVKQKKTPMECLMQYRNESDPSINQRPWSADEDRRLVQGAEACEQHDWCAVAEDYVGGGRTPLQCLQRFQIGLHKDLGLAEEWSAEEIEILSQAVKLYGTKNWQHVANCLPGRAANQCSARYRAMKQNSAGRRGRWEEDEERRLVLSVIAFEEDPATAPLSGQTPQPEGQEQGGGGERGGKVLWRRVATCVPQRGDVQCREKWVNVLDPLLDRGPFRPEEDEVILRHSRLHSRSDSGAGTVRSGGGGAVKWNLIASELGGRRTDNQIARRWKELHGGEAMARYKESARKRKAIVPSHHNRKCKGARSSSEGLDERDFAPTLQVAPPAASPALVESLPPIPLRETGATNDDDDNDDDDDDNFR